MVSMGLPSLIRPSEVAQIFSVPTFGSPTGFIADSLSLLMIAVLPLLLLSETNE